MSKVKIAIGVAVVGLVLAAGVVTSAAAWHRGTSGPAGAALHQQATHQVTTLAASKLKSSVIASGFSGAALTAGGFTPMDAGETIVCPGTTGTCTFEADASVQAQGTGSSNAWAICLYIVDLGQYATCPYYGFLDSSFFETGTEVSSFSGVPHGTHTVQTQIFSANGGAAYNYSITYHAYKP